MKEEPINLLKRKEYKLPVAMQLAAKRARQAQPKIVSILGTT